MPETNKPVVINDGMLQTRNAILRSMCAVYLIAFASFYYQSPGEGQFDKNGSSNIILCTLSGLFGEHGILPARGHIETSTSAIAAFMRKPTLLHFGFALNLDTGSMMDLICVLGTLIASAG